ncbi:MAG TPA: hypothetical protein VHO48_13150, partial [Anaerolineaceae bacterium]|nr:hypothetical protein [Anaerolineaceae bacterium]
MNAQRGLNITGKFTAVLVLALLTLAAVVLTALTGIHRLQAGTADPAQLERVVLIVSLVGALLVVVIGSILLVSFRQAMRQMVIAVQASAGSARTENRLDSLAQRGDEIGALSRTLGAASAAIQDRVAWYEAMLDAIPFPISVTDMNMRWTFINRPV